MCGIIAIYNKKLKPDECRNLVKDALNNQKSRGTHSFGVAILTPNGRLVRYRTLSLKALIESRIWSAAVAGSFVIAHNRYATSTIISTRFAHPFFNEKKDAAIVHNGVISDYLDLYESMKKRHRFESRHVIEEVIKTPDGKILSISRRENINDSEILIHLYENERRKITRRFFEISPMLALAIIDKKKRNLTIVRNGQSVFCFENDKVIIFTSEKLAKGAELETGSIVEVDSNGVQHKRQFYSFIYKFNDKIFFEDEHRCFDEDQPNVCM